jgi:glutamyl-tRNA reductase
MEAQIEKVDILVASTSAPHIVIKKSMIERVTAKRPKRPLFIIDLAVPRNVDPQASEVEDAVLINVDDLQEAAERNTRERLSELARVRTIIEEETKRFMEGQGGRGMSLLDLALG